ncbi:MAG: protein-glutamate O-methyltransferase CheR [Alphaproteobacteria bacterium]|nr:protein-glutamate O-methyltransferase CheR [Alphaproteobacteria bacterium]MCB1550400.1 protein-glutamate O-methyltransferase CheR [Alphaproteobacteria bacterium]MCB9985299.1 protein-glutamate O-methyltransferase CheR [Micavibrio sp.]HPQ51154.1 protein-glutamate O-methyltransferase CheR [Alphaproteobacteria bacterium]HRK98202.1 protein-glutamate O-methyltransferase CheR [Alphaproteobacteria bacterium]
MKISDFELFKSLLYERSGLVISPDKSYLLESRLTPIAKKWGLPSLESMTMQLRALPDEKLIKDIVEAMTTNETSFFRDTKPFQIFQDTILPVLLEKRKTRKSIRIWCAASSSGQEPYSLAMILKEKEAELRGWRFEIVATDISDEILDQAKRASYTQFEVQRGLPIQYLMKYFMQFGDSWQLKDEIRNMVRFSNFNLLDNMSRMGTFDIVFCRNVLIYFDEKNKGEILEKIAGQLENDGFLLLGGAETVLGITNKFTPNPEKRGLYIKSDKPASTIVSPRNASAAPSSTSSFTSSLFKRT